MGKKGRKRSVRGVWLGRDKVQWEVSVGPAVDACHQQDAEDAYLAIPRMIISVSLFFLVKETRRLFSLSNGVEERASWINTPPDSDLFQFRQPVTEKNEQTKPKITQTPTKFLLANVCSCVYR